MTTISVPIVSARRLAANQRNAKRSTGPKTREGKERSRTNALKHGLTAETLLLPGESAEEFEAFCSEVVAHLSPANVFEEQWAGASRDVV